MAIVDIPAGHIIYRLNLEALVISFAIAILTSVTAYILLIRGIRCIGAVNVSIYGIIEPLTGILCGLIFFREGITLRITLGCFFIFASVLIPIITDIHSEGKLSICS